MKSPYTKEKPSRDAETQNWKELKNIAESEAKTVSENLREQRNKKLTQKREKKRKREQSVEDMTPQPKKSFVEALTGLMSEYTDTQPKNGDEQEIFPTEAKDQPTVETMSRRQDRGPHKDDEKKEDIQKEQRLRLRVRQVWEISWS